VAAVRYPPGAFYGRHRDAARFPDVHGLHRRAVSVVIFVNSGGGNPAAEFTGGCLRLYELGEGAADDAVDIEPEAGTLVAFPSTLLHEVTAVDAGERYSLVAWLLSADAS
jgi:predicted 2-oxoglutarate/Fe(II)-dependent dioxygenase YbiX